MHLQICFAPLLLEAAVEEAGLCSITGHPALAEQTSRRPEWQASRHATPRILQLARTGVEHVALSFLKQVCMLTRVIGPDRNLSTSL